MPPEAGSDQRTPCRSMTTWPSAGETAAATLVPSWTVMVWSENAVATRGAALGGTHIDNVAVVFAKRPHVDFAGERKAYDRGRVLGVINDKPAARLRVGLDAVDGLEPGQLRPDLAGVGSASILSATPQPIASGISVSRTTSGQCGGCGRNAVASAGARFSGRGRRVI